MWPFLLQQRADVKCDPKILTAAKVSIRDSLILSDSDLDRIWGREISAISVSANLAPLLLCVL